MKLLLTIMALGLGSFSCAGYGGYKYSAHGEELIRSAVAGDEAPGWISGAIQSREGSIAFVGRGGGSNVLDERHAFDEALDHVRTQVANYIATKVVASGCLQDETDWSPQLGNSAFNNAGESQAVQHRAHQVSRALVGGASVSDQYWEQWDVYARNALYERELNDYRPSEPRYGTVRRYKCWVLSYISQDVMDNYVSATLAAIEKESQESQSQRDAAVAKSASLSVSLATMQNDMRAESYELQRLRERVNYGRRFRLVAREDCGHAAPDCDFERVHPDWRVVNPVVIPSTNLKYVESSCKTCNLSTNLH
jgi:hypothetical protein